MYMRLKDGKQKVLTLSYDDGNFFDKRLIEIFDKYGLLATFNLCSGRYYPEDGEDKAVSRPLKLSEAKELYLNSKHEIALHTYSHPVLTYLKSEQIIDEIFKDRCFAEKEFNRRVTGMAYSYNACNEEVFKIAENCGISYSRGRDTETFDFPENWLKFNPTCHHDNPRLFELADRFVNGDSRFWNELFFVWGHSHDLERNNNWDRIERFAELVGGKDNIWYATNIEIFEYVESWKRLIISADGKKVYNPTINPVWVEENGKIIKIDAGETKRLY